LNLSMFELARGYRESGMKAYSQLQERECGSESLGYEATRHQTFVGTGYFDLVTQVVAGGSASTAALQGSTESEQFAPMPPPTRTIAAPEEMLLPSGD
jgi:isocitrate lyase